MAYKKALRVVPKDTLGVVLQVQPDGTAEVQFGGVEFPQYVFPTSTDKLPILPNKGCEDRQPSLLPSPDARAAPGAGRKKARCRAKNKKFQEPKKFKQHPKKDFELTCRNKACRHGKTFAWEPTAQAFAMATFARRGTAVPTWCHGCRIDRRTPPLKK